MVSVQFLRQQSAHRSVVDCVSDLGKLLLNSRKSDQPFAYYCGVEMPRCLDRNRFETENIINFLNYCLHFVYESVDCESWK